MLNRYLIAIAITTIGITGCQPSASKIAKIQDVSFERSMEKGEQSSENLSRLGSEKSHPLDKYEERNDDPIAAAADRFQRRLSENGTVPDGALLRAKAQRDALLAAQSQTSAAGRSFNGGGIVWPVNWDWKGPGNIGGRLRPIVFDPSMPNIAYVGSASGGIWKTINGGSSWAPLDDFLPSLCVSDMVMHPSDPNILFAATGEGFFEALEGSSNTAAVRGAGIFKSVDAGTSWTQLPSTDNPSFYFVNRLAFDPTNTDVILAATGSGLWRTTDGGINWNLQLAVDALDVKFDPNDALNVVIGCHHEHDGPWYSDDGGLSWAQATGAGGHRQEIGWAPSVNGKVYAAVSDNGRIKIWESIDWGQTYSLVTTGNGIQTWSSYNNTVWVDPANDQFMILGGVYLYNSINGGESFTRRFNPVHADMHRIVPHPDFDGVTNKTVYFATDGGIWQTNDVYGNSAFDLNNNLGVTQFYGGGINPTTGHIVGGTQDNGTLFYSGDPQNWDHIFGGDGGYGAADPGDPDFFYGEVQRAYLHRTSNGGSSSGYIWNGPNPIGDAGSSNTTNFIPFFMLDPNDSNRMLVACERMWRSNNVKAGQPDWFSIKESIAPPGFTGDGSSQGRNASKPSNGSKSSSNSLPATGNRNGEPDNSHFNPNNPQNLSTIEVAIGNSDLIWAGHNNGNLYYSTDGTAVAPTWIRVDENGTGLPDRWISTIRVDPNDHNHVYVALMGWESDNLWETTDSGTTWIDVSGAGAFSVPDAPISALAIHRHLPGWLFVGTDIGIFTSSDNGLSWSTSPEGPAATPVEQLLWKNDHELLAVTHGRGMYVATETSILADGKKLLDGVERAGTLTDASASDDVYYELDPNPTTNPFKQIVDLILVAESPVSSPDSFQFRVQANMVGGTSDDVVQEVRLFNHQTNSFESVSIQPASSSDTTVLVAPTGDLTRFIHSTTNEIQARITWDSQSFVGAPFTWFVRIDQAIWLIQ